MRVRNAGGRSSRARQEARGARRDRDRVDPLRGKTVALAITGSIAAYKAVLVARLLVTAGAKVIPLMTTSATRFVGAVTLTGITGEPCRQDMWDPAFPGEMHVAIAARADVLAIVPATADVLARLAQGRADDLVTATALCARGPVVVAPAMHPRMWAHAATQRNVSLLTDVHLVGPVVGPVASGEVGLGRMAEPEAIVLAIRRALVADLAGKKIVVTAGPTFEAVDPVRFLGNRSSGKMGFAIAARAAARGASVTLISGPVSLTTPRGVKRVDVESAEEMRRALRSAVVKADALVMAAAVADFRPAAKSVTKIKKGTGKAVPTLALEQNPDLIAEIGRKRRGRTPLLIAFALETGTDAEVLRYARAKLLAKKVDVIVANAAHESLGRDDNRVSLVDARGATPFVSGSKDAVADVILERVVRSS